MVSSRDQVAVVTGGAQGIGFAVAKSLLQAGSKIVIWDRNSQAADRAVQELSPFGDVRASVLDVRDQESVAAAARQLPGGTADILVNSAAIVIRDQPVFDTSLDDWRLTLEVNVIGVFNCCKQLVPQMASRGWGRVVNVASMSGKDGNVGMAAYSASKAAVIGLTKVNWEGIRANWRPGELRRTKSHRHARRRSSQSGDRPHDSCPGSDGPSRQARKRWPN